MAKLTRDYKTLLILTVFLLAAASFYFFYAVPFVDKKIRDLKVRSIVTKNITQAELIKYGLKDPGFIITLLKKNRSERLTLNLGDLTPDGMGVYAYRNGRQEIIILPMYLTILLNRNLYDLRDKNVFYFDIERVRQVEIAFARHRIVLVKIAEKNGYLKSH